MLRTKTLFHIVNALWLLAILVFSRPLFAQNAITVSGRITADEVTRSRVIRVALTSPALPQPLTTVADSDGTFEFSNVMPGSYTAIAFASTSVSAPMTLTAGSSNITNLTLSLPEPKTISGRVTVQGNLPSTVPPPRVVFALAAVAGIPGSTANVPANAQPDGSFQIMLPQGERRITISPASIPAGYKLASFTYGTADLLKNQVRIAAADKTELRVTFDASAITSVKVSGQVANLLTTQGVRVVLVNPVSGSFETSVNPDGSFVFPKVIPGNYVARLSLSGLTASKQVSVADRDVTDVLITYPRQFVVGGHVIVEGASANDDVPEVTLEARQSNGSDVARSPSLVTGTIILTVKDGEYNVSARSIPAGYQLKSITYGTTDLQKAPLKIDGPVTWEIIVRLTKV